MSSAAQNDGRQALAWLNAAMAQSAAAGLHRTLRPRPRGGVINLASNDYLGLSRYPAVVKAGIQAIEQCGAGATASRLVVGTVDAHTAFEADFADFVNTEAALAFSSGYMANVGAITALATRGDLIVSDGGAHASLIDGARLSKARIAVVERGDYAGVDRELAKRTEQRALVITDSVYSIDGSIAPIAELHHVARTHNAVLLVDEAHAIGVRGPGGSGVVAEKGLCGEPDIVVTAVASKSLGAQGGMVAGSSVLIDYLVDHARTFIFDTGLAPAAVAAAHAALAHLRQHPSLATDVRDAARRLAVACGAAEPDSAVVFLIIGDPAAAARAAAYCRERDVIVGCFRPPSVPDGTARLRLTARADLTDTDITAAAVIVNEAVAREGISPS